MSGMNDGREMAEFWKERAAEFYIEVKCLDCLEKQTYVWKNKHIYACDVK